MKTILTPFHDNIILEAIEPQETVGTSKIIVPEAHRTELSQGKVLDKGPLVSDRIKVGAVVFFAPHSETRLKWRGKKLRVVTEANCLGSIEEVEEEALKLLQEEKRVDPFPQNESKHLI